MNESKFSKQIRQLDGFDCISLERLPIVGCPDLLYTSTRLPSMSMFVELKTVPSVECKIKYQPAQPNAINDMYKVGTVVGTLVFCERDELIVWVNPESTKHVFRLNMKVHDILLSKMGDVICGTNDPQWKETISGFFDGLIRKRAYLNTLN